jgi:ankyrin repeat protein
VVKLLLDSDVADVDLKDKDNRTPLSYTAGNGHEGIFKLLLATGESGHEGCLFLDNQLLYIPRWF